MSRHTTTRIWWFEPYRFRFLTRAERAHTFWHEFPIAVAVFSGNFLAIWLASRLFAWLDPTRKVMDFIDFLPFIVTGGLMLGGLMCGTGYLMPRSIAFGEQGVLCSSELRHRRWHYDQIAYVGFDTVPEGTGAARVMLIVLRDGHQTLIGIPNRLELARLIDLLKSKGVEIAEKDGMMSGARVER